MWLCINDANLHIFSELQAHVAEKIRANVIGSHFACAFAHN
jgi:hypothetical protein